MHYFLPNVYDKAIYNKSVSQTITTAASHIYLTHNMCSNWLRCMVSERQTHKTSEHKTANPDTRCLEMLITLLHSTLLAKGSQEMYDQSPGFQTSPLQLYLTTLSWEVQQHANTKRCRCQAKKGITQNFCALKVPWETYELIEYARQHLLQVKAF